MFALWLQPTQAFKTFGAEHFLTLAVILIFSGILIIYSRKRLNKKQQHRVAVLLGLLPLLGSMNRMLTMIYTGEFTVGEELPLYLCRFMAIVMPFLMYYRNKTLFGIMFFSVLAGTMNAIITPDLKFGIPHFMYFSYWLLHAGLVLCIMYLVFVYRMLPRFSDIWRTIIWVNIYMMIVHLLNYLLNSNYSYTMSKPPSPSPLDFMGEWPFYLLSVELVAIGLFFILYVPVWFYRKGRNA